MRAREASPGDNRDPSDRGRRAARPQDIPAAGWWDITLRVFKRLGSDNITLVSGGVAMYLLLSVFPALAAAVSIYGLFATPADVVKHMQVFAGVLPPGVWQIFSSQLQVLAGHAQSSLSIGAALGLVIALWSARSAMSAFMTATNIAYGEHEKRSFFVQVVVSLVLTGTGVLSFLLMLLLGIAIPLALSTMGVQPARGHRGGDQLRNGAADREGHHRGSSGASRRTRSLCGGHGRTERRRPSLAVMRGIRPPSAV